MKKSRLSLVIFYLFIVSNVLCESGCDPTCDPVESVYTVQVEECEHPSCELSHQDQHKYVKDNSSDSSKKKYVKSDEPFVLNPDFKIIFLDNLHLNESALLFSNNSVTYFFPKRKRFLVFQRLKVFHS